MPATKQNLVCTSLFLEGFPDPPPFGDIVSNLGSAHDVSSEVAHRRNDQGNVEPPGPLGQLSLRRARARFTRSVSFVFRS
jgi:hypothetical protein